MKKEIILDIETTGLNINNDRIIEVGCIEIINRKITKNILHIYINPEKTINKDAIKIHGLTQEFLKNKPKFKEIANLIYKFTYKATIIAHNALFDINFLNKEFKRIGLEPFTKNVKNVIDTLKIARNKFPGKHNSLKSLCKKYNISLKNRKYHGALIDAKLLAKIYLILTINQKNLFKKNQKIKKIKKIKKNKISNLKILNANSNELKTHKKFKNFINNNNNNNNDKK